jgi:CHAT domain-containing protein
MHPKMQSLWLSVTLALLSIWGLTVDCLSPFEASIVLAQLSDNNSRKVEADQLLNQGYQQFQTSQFQTALQSWQQALGIYKEIRDRLGEGQSLGNLGLVYRNLGNYPKAVEFHQQSLAIAREIQDRSGEGAALGNLGLAYYSLGNYPKAIEFQMQSLAIAREIKNRLGEGQSLGNLGLAYYSLGNYPKAIEFQMQRLAIAHEIKDRQGEGQSLGNLGLAYYSLGNYPKAIEFQMQNLAIAREIKDRQGEGAALGNLGIAYDTLGNYPKAIEFHQQRLAIARETQNRLGEGQSLGNLGLAYYSLENYPKAIEFQMQSLAIAREIKDRLGEGQALGDLGLAYYSLGNYPKAIEFQMQSLAIAREIKDRQGEGNALRNLGIAYDALRNYPKAIELQMQSLTITREISYRNGEALGLTNLAKTLENQNQTALAIIFYKQAVNIRESIRKDLRSFPIEQQKIYTESVAYSYRSLADLLLQQNRILEAQQVLDLLKIQELQDYLRTVRGNATTAKGLDILQPEQQILAKYDTLQNSAIQLGQELSTLQQTPEPNRTPTQQQRITQLKALQEDLNRQFNDFINSEAVQTPIAQLNPSTLRQTVDLADLDALRDNLRQLNAVLLYPLILPDRLELIITTPDSAPLRRTVKVSNTELNKTILEFRQQMQACETKPCTAADTETTQAISQKLYAWLIKPLEADLKQANAQSIIYAPDGQLRYIPLAALHDGKKWLAQSLRVNNITAKSLDSLAPQSSTSPLKVLAGAFTQGNYQFNVGPQQFNFDGLPFARKEITQLVAAVPGTTHFLDKSFSLATIKPRMNEYNVLHLATHAAFLPGQPENSFILFGNGDRATLSDIANWSLFNVDMVILSACETGLGMKLGDGVEILGLGYQFQNRGVKATIASLWQVNDESTQILMNTLYAQLKQGNTSKAEALRQAQLTLIQGKGQTSSKNRAGITVQPTTGKEASQPTAIDHSHPYYWAPFILIGNGF